MANAHCMLDTQGHKYTLRICYTYCFSTTTLVAQTCLNVMLYIHCLSCFSKCLASTLSFARFENSPQRCPHNSLVSKLFNFYLKSYSTSLNYPCMLSIILSMPEWNGAENIQILLSTFYCLIILLIVRFEGIHGYMNREWMLFSSHKCMT